LRRVSSKEWPMTALPTTETTDAIAAPTIVPATPNCAPMNAATTAADMLAVTWVAVNENFGASASSVSSPSDPSMPGLGSASDAGVAGPDAAAAGG